MNWITNFVRPKINLQGLFKKNDTPDNLWRKCPACGHMIFHKDLPETQYVCPNCQHHMRIGPKERFQLTFDHGKWEPILLPDVPVDPLKFRDGKKYSDRLKEARAKTGDPDALLAARGTVGGVRTTIAVQNFAFMGGSLGMAVGEGLVTAMRSAVAEHTPFVVFTASGGARMQEGILSLMQMPRTTIAIQLLREAGLPYIVVHTDPTTGGVTASYAMLGDVHIAEPGALIGFSGPRVIENTIRAKLPEGFQRAEFLQDHGMVDMVIHRHQLKDILGRTLSLLTRKRTSQALTIVPEVQTQPVTILQAAQSSVQETAPARQDSA